MTLDQLKIGASGTITSVGGDGPLRCRLLDMGLIPRTRVTLQKIAPMGDPIQIQVRGYELTLRREDAALQETEDFLTRVYNGSVSLLVSSMTRRQALSQEEIDQLYALLQQLEDQKGAD